MFKKYLIAIIPFVLLIAMVASQGFGAESNETKNRTGKPDPSSIRYSSAKFTQPEPKHVKGIDQKVSFEGYKKVAENEELILYVNEDSLAIKVQNKNTGYVWSSGLDHPENYRLNKTWEQIVQSAITVEYIDKKGKVRTESILTNDSKHDLELKKNGFTANISLFQAKLDLTLNVELAGNEMIVSVPFESIKEGKYNKLVSLELYPFFGAVHQDDIQGYMFIPDGSGALIRYEKSKKTNVSPFVGSIFGLDEGIKTKSSSSDVVPVQQIKMPVFGAVHGTNHNGFLAIVEEGAYIGDILAYPAGAVTDFNRVSAKFHYRYNYYQPTSKNMSGVYIYQKDLNPENIKLRYQFLSNKEANYVGMAKAYRNYLVENGQLMKKEDQVNVRLEFLGGENKEGLLWDSILPMTKIKEIPGFIKELKDNHVNNLFVIYKGWSKGGLSGTLPNKFPFEKSLGSKSDVLDTIVNLKHEQVPIYFYTDYTKAYDGASGFSNRDIAQKISSETISNKENDLTYYYLSPDQSVDIAEKDIKKYQEYGMENLAIDTTGYTLFSDYQDSKELTREDTKDQYEKLFTILKDKIGPLALYEPIVYAWKTADKYLDIPMNSSMYVYETDTVPFIQIVLKGYISYYAPFANFYSNPEDQLLRMIEYGAYPSFLLTKEPSHLLADTNSEEIYTSEFAVWKDEIIHQYKAIHEALGQVESATIEERIVPQVGVVEVSYSNGKKIIVNYTNSEYVNGRVQVAAKSFLVVDKGEE